MNNEDRCFCELAPLYVLGLLSEADRAWVEQQASVSSDLAAELAELEMTVGAIPYGAPLVPVPPDLKERLFQRLSQSILGTEIVSVPDEIDTPLESASVPTRVQEHDLIPTTANRRRSVIWLQAVSVIAALALITLLVDNYRLRQDAQETKAVIAALQQPHTIVYPLKGTEKAENASGSLVVNSSQKAVTLLAQNLAKLPIGQMYRLWAMPKGMTKPVYCGQFNGSSGKTTTHWTVPNTACNTQVSQMLVTAEAETAPPVPTGPLVMKSAL
jgi:hypothetical protein